jgi:hypothetical protein
MAGNEERLRALVKSGLQQLGSPDALASKAGQMLPAPVRRVVLGRALDGVELSLCLHRVLPSPRATDWQSGLSIPAPVLEALIDELLRARSGSPGGWLSVTFDDGYRDAGEWLLVNAPRFPDVDFVFFICPEKTEARTGFRWDLVEERLKSGTPRDEAIGLMAPVPDVLTENLRPELQALPALPEYPLTAVDELRALQELPNVKLGNHTNLHLSSTRFPDEVVKADFERSTAHFEKLFGPLEHFAFPFGTPKHHFAQRHVQWLRALGKFPIWTTESRPFRPAEKGPSAVLPRFPVDGRQDAASLAGWIAARSLDFRVRGSKHHF